MDGLRRALTERLTETGVWRQEREAIEAFLATPGERTFRRLLRDFKYPAGLAYRYLVQREKGDIE